MTTGIEKDFHPGDTVCREGDSGEYIYILKKGSLGVYKNDNLVSQYNVPGTILGEMSIILGESRSASIKAITASTVSVIRLSLMDMVTNFPSFTVKILRTLAERLKDTTEELSLSVVDHHPDDDF